MYEHTPYPRIPSNLNQDEFISNVENRLYLPPEQFNPLQFVADLSMSEVDLQRVTFAADFLVKRRDTDIILILNGRQIGLERRESKAFTMLWVDVLKEVGGDNAQASSFFSTLQEIKTDDSVLTRVERVNRPSDVISTPQTESSDQKEEEIAAKLRGVLNIISERIEDDRRYEQRLIRSNDPLLTPQISMLLDEFETTIKTFASADILSISPRNNGIAVSTGEETLALTAQQDRIYPNEWFIFIAPRPIQYPGSICIFYWKERYGLRIKYYSIYVGDNNSDKERQLINQCRLDDARSEIIEPLLTIIRAKNPDFKL